MAHLPSYSAILNELNRDVARNQPEDVLQYCANWVRTLRSTLHVNHAGLTLGASSSAPLSVASSSTTSWKNSAA